VNYRNYVTWCYGEIQGRSFGEGAAPADYQGTEHSALVAVAKRALNVVFCLMTSLRFYKITTQSLFEVWIACPMFLLIVERYSPNYGEFAWQANVCPACYNSHFQRARPRLTRIQYAALKRGRHR